VCWSPRRNRGKAASSPIKSRLSSNSDTGPGSRADGPVTSGQAVAVAVVRTKPVSKLRVLGGNEDTADAGGRTRGLQVYISVKLSERSSIVWEHGVWCM
jgi:hypothetical protein